MSNSIPVFAFALAAYAATSHRDASPRVAVPPNEIQSAFLRAFRLFPQSNGHMWARIRLAEPGDLARDTAWVGEITKTPLGFRGRLERTPLRPHGGLTGSQVDFRADQVLGWTVGVEEAPPADAADNASAEILRLDASS